MDHGRVAALNKSF